MTEHDTTAESAPIDVLPLGPFPPHGVEGPGQVDLGIRLRDEVFHGRTLVALRPRILARLEAAVDLDRRDEVAQLIQDYVDSWPVAALVDEARTRWAEGPDAPALAVLVRAAEVFRAATGAPPLGPGPWPRPSPDWMRKRAGDRPKRLLSRGPADGSSWVAQALSIEVTGEAPTAAPLIEVVAGRDLAERRAELGRRLVRSEIVGVEVTEPVPNDPATLLTLGEIRLEGSGQPMLERYGRAAAGLREVPGFTALLAPAPAGKPGPKLARRSDVALLPGTPDTARHGQYDPVGWLVWPAPHPPAPVYPVAAMLLRDLGDDFDRKAWADAQSVPLEMVDDLLDQLVALGAASA